MSSGGGRRTRRADVLRHHAARLREEPLPPGLRSRCESIVQGGSAGARVPGWRRTLVPTVLSVILLVFTASAIFSLATRRSDAVLAAQLTADHSKCFKLFVGEESSMSAEEAEQFLSQQYGWKIHVPPSTAGMQLLGVRRCLYADGLIPHVMYRSNGAGSLALRPERRHPSCHGSGHVRSSIADLDAGRTRRSCSSRRRRRVIDSTRPPGT